MKLRTKRRLLNSLALLLLSGAAGVLWHTWSDVPPRHDVTIASSAKSGAVKAPSIEATQAIALNPGQWNRILRQPLYDPPPPPPPQVVVEHRPITVTVVGTVIEAENSQAFVKQQSGAVEIKRQGDQVTTDAADGVIASITPTEIVIRREDGEHHVTISGR